jgi:hypothetical protein
MQEISNKNKDNISEEKKQIAKETILQPSQRIVIRVPARHNPRLQQVIDRVNADDELYMLWQVTNINAVQRLAMNDHGPVHVQIVTNIALKLLRLPSTECDAQRCRWTQPHDRRCRGDCRVGVTSHDMGCRSSEPITNSSASSGSTQDQGTTEGSMIFGEDYPQLGDSPCYHLPRAGGRLPEAGIVRLQMR